MDIIEKIYSQNEAFVKNENFAGVKKVIVDNYSDDVHFVYELLQNADDVSATEISFELRKDRLLVTHNGTPFSEKDLKAICSISKGTKAGDYTKIGRFGIGFKSVFVYTDSPQIYSGMYSFEIRDLVLPQKITAQSDLPEDKTLFVIPFNAAKTKKTACSNICKKLQDITYEALLFLNHITTINIAIVLDDEDNHIVINKNIESDESLDNNENIQRINITIENEQYDDLEQWFWLMTKSNIELIDSEDDDNDLHIYNQSVKIAFVEDDEEVAPCPCSYWDNDIYNCLYVFFPTRIQSNCEFIIHAPFVTKSSRDTIALNNYANSVLKHNIGVLIADSLFAFAKRDMLSLDLIDELYYTDHKDEEIWKSYSKRLKELIKDGKELIPCGSYNSKALSEVLFTTEKTTTFESIMKLFGREWLANYYKIPNTFEICQIEGNCAFYDFLKTNFKCKELSLQEIVNSIGANFYSEKSSQWFIDFINLFVVKSNFGYDILLDNIDRFPFVRRKDGTHTNLEKANNVFLNNGTLDEEILSNPAVKYLYEYVYKFKNYSVELGDAKEAIKEIKSLNIDRDFERYAELLSKVLIAIDMRKLSYEDIESEPIMLVQNQKNNNKKKVAPPNALIGTWTRTNGDYDLYILLKGVDVNLLDPRYMQRFDVRELKQLGCKEGLDYYDVSRYSYLMEIGAEDAWSAKHIRPLPGRANNRMFKPLQQIKYVPEMLAAPMSLEKSILILRLAKDFDNQIVDWIEWSSRADYSPNASSKGLGRHYSAFGSALHSGAWLYNYKNQIVKPTKVEVDKLSPEYKKYITSDIAEKLGIKKSKTEAIESLMKQLKSNGYYAIPLEEMEEFEEFKRRKQEREAELEEYNRQLQEQNNNDNNEHIIPAGEPEDYSESHTTIEDFSSIEGNQGNSQTRTSERHLPRTGHSVIDSIVEKSVGTLTDDINENASVDYEQEEDEDEYTPKTVDYEAQKRKKEKSYAADIKLMQHKDDLQKQAVDAKKYSFLWFKTLLEMESLAAGESNANRQTVSITFAGVPEKVKGKQRTLILKNPDVHIPAFIEDLADIPLYFNDGKKETKIEIDAASVKSYTLKVKIKSAEELEKIDLSKVKSVRLDAQSPTFLLEELRKQYNSLSYEDDYDMRANLCENIGFVFGPPGTGKTTYLAKEVLIPLMKQDRNCKVLVLTPTNKAADVITNRIIECSGADISYENWLVRFGSTGDEDIENSNIYFHKDYDINRFTKNVTVTTIDRFPYDFFMPQNKGVQLLQDVDWDFIVIDEASMIPIHKIVYPLYKKKPHRFIIAGDPFQIEPIAHVSLWKDENIYTMVNLDSFSKPKTVPHNYKIVKLMKQYRSIPEVGKLFSKFAYNGALSHDRKTNDQKKIDFGNDLSIHTFNIIKFPVSKYENIYRSKKLNNSAYHVYSALFTYEYTMFLANRISTKNPNLSCRIGVIAPYRAEADLINKLVSAEKIPDSIDIQVGTIHGFQGDECDIVIAVFNAPQGMSNSDGMFLNKKTIMNVAISRARDYLFIIMPDNQTEKIENLRLVRKIEQLIKESNVWREFDTHSLEKIMFGDPYYLEHNSFATSHQSVNVYGLPEYKYEIRAEEAAVDIQVHKEGIEFAKEKESELDIEKIPEALRKNSDIYFVDGDLDGQYYIAPYSGSLSEYITKQMEQMFFIVQRDGRDKRIQVKVDLEDRVIYIAEHEYLRSRQQFALSEKLKIKYRLY